VVPDLSCEKCLLGKSFYVRMDCDSGMFCIKSFMSDANFLIQNRRVGSGHQVSPNDLNWPFCLARPLAHHGAALVVLLP
jgi:hypothetical protein